MCSQEQVARAACILDAAANCTPTHQTITLWLDRDGWIVTDILVLPKKGVPGCDIVEFTDPTRVNDHCKSVSRTTCGEVYLEDDWWGCSIRTTRCREYVEVVSDPSPDCDW